MKSTVSELAERVRLSRTGQRPPYILFLGAKCAEAASAPTLVAIARMALSTFGLESDTTSLTDDGLVRKYYEHLRRLPRTQIARMLQSLYAKVAVPSFYVDVAFLIREKYFPIVVTTNYDTLLDQALASVGVSKAQCRITTIGLHPTEESSPDAPDDNVLVDIVKLHGDIANDQVPITPAELDRALDLHRSAVKSDLRGDMIMVGHSTEGDPIDQWLAHSPSRELWWIGPDESAPLNKIASWSNDIREITGEAGRIAPFFAELRTRVLQQDIVDDVLGAIVMPAPEAKSAEPVVLESLDFGGPVSENAAPPENALLESLQSEIRRNQAALYMLEQEVAPADRNAKAQAQIDYQKRQITRLEDKIRSLPETRRQVTEIMTRIRDSIQKAGADPSVTFKVDPGLHLFLDTNVNVIQLELAKSEPNQLLLSASLGATLTLADRLVTEWGSKVVNPDDVRILASFAPTAASKVFL